MHFEAIKPQRSTQPDTSFDMPVAVAQEISRNLTATPKQSLNAFQCLAHDLSDLLAGSPGMNFSDIDPNHIIRKMNDYTSNHKDWTKYAHKDSNKCFTRNLVDPGDGKHNLVG